MRTIRCMVDRKGAWQRLKKLLATQFRFQASVLILLKHAFLLPKSGPYIHWADMNPLGIKHSQTLSAVGNVPYLKGQPEFVRAPFFPLTYLSLILKGKPNRSNSRFHTYSFAFIIHSFNIVRKFCVAPPPVNPSR